MDSRLLSGSHLQKNILLTVNDLPPMPQLMHKALGIAQDPRADLKDLANLIEADQALAIKVLRLSNSAYYSRVGKVSSLQEAAVLLGLKTLSELIMIACTSQLLGRPLNGYSLQAKSLWRHSLAVAVASRIVADKRYPAMTDEAFTAGLIHDAGKLILDKYVLERKEEFSRFLADGEETFVNAEKEILGFDHAEIAEKVCAKWNFPKSLSIAIKYHHYPSRLRANKLAYIVHVADQLAIWSGMDIGEITLEIDDGSRKILGIENSEIEPIMDEIVKSVNQITGQEEKENTQGRTLPLDHTLPPAVHQNLG